MDSLFIYSGLRWMSSTNHETLHWCYSRLLHWCYARPLHRSKAQPQHWCYITSQFFHYVLLHNETKPRWTLAVCRTSRSTWNFPAIRQYLPLSCKGKGTDILALRNTSFTVMVAEGSIKAFEHSWAKACPDLFLSGWRESVVFTSGNFLWRSGMLPAVNSQSIQLYAAQNRNIRKPSENSLKPFQPHLGFLNCQCNRPRYRPSASFSH